MASLSPPRDYEVIVVDDDSSDQTASIASDHQAVVVPSKCRNIGAARNLGFEASRGDPLVFVDADTLVDPDLLNETWKALESGAAWGTARVTPSDACPLWVRFLGYFYNRYYTGFRGYAYGCYFFMRREAFVAAGRFPDDLLEGEDQALSRVLTEKFGRVHLLSGRVKTSARKAREFGFWFHMRLLWRSIFDSDAASRHPDVAKYRDGDARLRQ